MYFSHSIFKCTWSTGEWNMWGAGAAARYRGGCAMRERPEPTSTKQPRSA